MTARDTRKDAEISGGLYLMVFRRLVLEDSLKKAKDLLAKSFLKKLKFMGIE